MTETTPSTQRSSRADHAVDAPPDATTDRQGAARQAWRRARDARPETRIAVVAAGLGILLLPVDWMFGWITAGMSASTRATVAAGALTSAAVTAALSTFEHRRLDDERKERETRLDQLERLADEPALRLLRRIAHGYRMAVSSVALKWEDRAKGPGVLGEWEQEDLNLLSSTLTWQTLHLPSPSSNIEGDGVDHCRALLVCCHLAADVLTAAKGAGLGTSIEEADADLPDVVRVTMDRLDRIADALMTQAAPPQADSVLQTVNHINTLWLVADRHLPWGADLAGELVASFAGTSDEKFGRRALAIATSANEENEFWMEDADARRTWLRDRRRRASTLHDRARLPRNEDAQASPRRVRGVDEDEVPAETAQE